MRVGHRTLLLDVIGISVVALLVGLIRLGTASLWLDESITARAMNVPVDEVVGRLYHLPYYALQKPWVALAGTSEWALRLPSVAGSVAACILLVVLAHKLFDRRVALVSGLFLAMSPFMVKWSQQARGYTFVVAIGLLATLLLLRALERRSRGSWTAYSLAFSMLVLWHPVPGILLVPAHAVLVAQRRERVLPHGFVAALIIGALAVPWAAIVAMASTGERAAMNWLTFPTTETAIRALLDVSGAAGIGVVLAAAGLWLLHRSGRSGLALWLGAWAFAPFVLAILVSLGRPIYLDRYLIIAAPAFALLAGIALTSLEPRLRAFAAAAAVAAVSIGLMFWYTSSGDGGNWRGEDWRTAVAAVLERQEEADAIVVAPWAARPAAEYYGASVVDTSRADTIWVLTWSETGDTLPDTDRRGLGFGEHRLVERTQFGWRVTAELWARRP